MGRKLPDLLLAAKSVPARRSFITAAKRRYTAIGSVVKTAAAALLAASLAVVAPAHADDPVPTVEQVVAIMAELTDPGQPAASKTDIVTPGLTPDEASTTDDRLNSLNGRGYIPFEFVVTDIQPSPDNFAGATVAAPKPVLVHFSIPPTPIVLTERGGRWLITRDAAITWLNKMWSSTRNRI